MKIYKLSLLILILFTSCTTKYYIVRHAEKRNLTDTSSLTIQGQQRAEALKDLLDDKGINHIYASVFKRTQLTAAPLANEINKSPVIYSLDTTQALAEQLKRFSGSDILIVGHTNNIPELINLLSDESIAPIDEADFDNLYIVEVKRNLVWTSKYLTSTTYGVPSP